MCRFVAMRKHCVITATPRNNVYQRREYSAVNTGSEGIAPGIKTRTNRAVSAGVYRSTTCLLSPERWSLAKAWAIKDGQLCGCPDVATSTQIHFHRDANKIGMTSDTQLLLQ